MSDFEGYVPVVDRGTAWRIHKAEYMLSEAAGNSAGHWQYSGIECFGRSVGVAQRSHFEYKGAVEQGGVVVPVVVAGQSCWAGCC